jgi:hypothetical protein
VVVAIGTRGRDPDLPDGEKPVPLQVVALVLVQVSVVDSGYHSEVGDAERVTVGAAALAWAVNCAPPRPKINSEEASKPSLIFVNTVRDDMCSYS